MKKGMLGCLIVAGVGVLIVLILAVSLMGRYNRFVMDPDSQDPAELRSVLGEFGVLVDVVLFATKLYDTESAGEQCKPFIGDETVERWQLIE